MYQCKILRDGGAEVDIGWTYPICNKLVIIQIA